MTPITTESEAAEFWKRLDEKSRLLLAKGAPVVVSGWVIEAGGSMRRSSCRVYECDGEWFLQECGATVAGPMPKDEALAMGNSRLRELGLVLEDGE